MKRLPIFASVSKSTVCGTDRTRLIFLRNTIYQSATTLRFDGWNRTNLLNAIRTRADTRLSNSLFEVVGDEEPSVYLDSGEQLSLAEAINALTAAYPLSLVFVLTAPCQLTRVHSYLNSLNAQSVVAVVSDHDPFGFLFALCLETSHWWDLKSALYTDVTFKHVADCARRVIENLNLSYPDLLSASFIENVDGQKGVAWTNGKMYASADIEKFMRGARPEQLDDTIKRVFDAAIHPRYQHMTREERLVCSQGLFWLAELVSANDMKNWFTGTRLFAEVFPARSLTPTSPNLVLNVHPDFHIETFISSLVEVPEGDYIVGSNNHLIDSEPPTAEIQVQLNRFHIMRQPVTEAFWFQNLDSTNRIQHQLPKTNVSYFEAEAFAAALQAACRRALGASGDKVEVRLPTEFEWEVAARGPSATNYPWGDSFELSRCNCDMVLGRVSSVGQFSPSGDSFYGCQDMSGNVREWTRSYAGTRGLDWTGLHQRRVNGDDDVVIGPLSRMIIRGGSYSYSADCTQGWVRNTQIASRRDRQTGLRLVVRGL